MLRLKPPNAILVAARFTILIAGATMAGVAATAAEPLRIQGSTTFFDRILGPNLSRIEAMASTRLTIVPNKSVWGLIALLERRAT